jgi:transposase
MPVPRKYPNELHGRAIWLVLDLVEDPGGPSINGACLRVGDQLGINGDTLRN